MDNIIMQNENGKLVEFLGSYQLFAMRTMNYDGIRDWNIVHVMTFYDNGSVRNEIAGKMYNVSNAENFNVREYAIAAFEHETMR